jgi:hypothetical protein
MQTTALIMMVSTLSVVTLMTGYFFVRVLTTPAKPDRNSFTDTDDEPVRPLN